MMGRIRTSTDHTEGVRTIQLCYYIIMLGWKMGFEPTKVFRLLEPQSSAFDHSATTTMLNHHKDDYSSFFNFKLQLP